MYRQYRVDQSTTITRHYRKVFQRLGFFSCREGSSTPILVRDEKKILKRLLDSVRLTVTQRAWVYASCWTYVLDDEALPKSFLPEFSWVVFLDQLPKHAVSQRKLAVVTGYSHVHLSKKLASPKIRKLVSSKHTYLFTNRQPCTKLWFKAAGGGYLRPWNNEYSSKVEHTRVHRTFFFEKAQLWQKFRAENNPRSVPVGRRIHQSPQSGPATWLLLARRTISRTNKVRSRMPASQRNKEGGRFLDSKDLHKLTYRTIQKTSTFGSEEKSYGVVSIDLATPCRVRRDEHRFATQPMMVRKGTVKQILSRSPRKPEIPRPLHRGSAGHSWQSRGGSPAGGKLR